MGEGRGEAVRRVLRLVLALNLGILALKLLAWSLTGSLSIIAEATHSSLDALNNIIALAFARVAHQGPDEDHPYGHHKFETLGALAVVGFLSITVFELVKGAIGRLASPAALAEVQTPIAAFLLLGATVLAGSLVARYEVRAGLRLNSELLLADAAHTRADVLGTVAVLAGLLLVRLGYPLADPIVALLLALLIAHSGWEIVRRSVPILVDERAVNEEALHRLAGDTEGVLSSHRARSRGRPGEIFVELTIRVRGDLDVHRAHEIADEVERRISVSLGAREVVVHVEPAE